MDSKVVKAIIEQLIKASEHYEHPGTSVDKQRAAKEMIACCQGIVALLKPTANQA